MIIHDYPFEKVGYIEQKEEKIPFCVRATSSLKKYKEPSYQSKMIGSIINGGIVDIFKISGNWGCLDDNSWIDLAHTKKL